MPFVFERDGHLHGAKLEYNLVDNCNLACRECSHFSPYLKGHSLSLESFRRDLGRLSEVYRVRRFRFVGGEPLLNAKIINFVQEVRRSGITEQIEVVTNGVLLDKMPDKLLEEIDKLTVSWYPVARYNQEIIESTRQKCKNQGVSLHIEHIDRFRRMQVREGIKDVDLVKKIFDSCLIAHTWNCQTFYDGFFYLCSRPIFTDLFIEKLGGPFQGLRHSDGLPLHAPNLKERLRRFVSSVNPLGSCRYCLGTVGLYYPHEQIASAERQNPEISAEPPEGDIDKLRLWYLLQWRKVERFLIKAIPSSRLSRILCLIQTATIGD